MTDSPPPLARVIVRNTVWTSLGSYANILLGFGANLVLTRLLPVEIFGYLAMGSFWTSQLNLRPKSGIHYAAIQEEKLAPDLLGTYFITDLLIAAVSFTLGGIVAAILVWLGYPAPVIVAVIVLMAAETLPALAGVLGMALEKELQVSRLTLNSIVASAIGYLAAIGLALLNAGVWSLLVVNLSLAILGSAGVLVVCRQRLPGVFSQPWRFSAAIARELLRRGIPTGLSFTAVLAIVSTYDNFLVGTFAGYDTLGYYDRAFRTAQWPNALLSTIVGRIGFLMFAKVQTDPERLLHAVRLSLWVLLSLGIPIGLFLSFGAPDIIELLYGARWLQSAVYLRFLAVYALAGMVFTLAFWLAVASKATRTMWRLTLSQAGTLILVGTPLTWWLGVAGTLVGVGSAMAVATWLSLRYIFSRVPIGPREALLPVGLATAVTVAGLLLLRSWPGWQSLPDLAQVVVTGAVSGGLFLGALYVAQPTTLRERVTYLWQAWRRP